eukprot:COSAG06_NODE_35330_length_461_cov_1.082873_2_plen_60_part_01
MITIALCQDRLWINTTKTEQKGCVRFAQAKIDQPHGEFGWGDSSAGSSGGGAAAAVELVD